MEAKLTENRMHVKMKPKFENEAQRSSCTSYLQTKMSKKNKKNTVKT